MFNFKSQLVSFGKYRYAQIESQLPLISNPRKRNFSLVWISTPVAAVVGLLVGLSINFCGSDMKKNENMVEVKTLNEVLELPEYCCVEHRTVVNLPEFEIIINHKK